MSKPLFKKIISSGVIVLFILLAPCRHTENINQEYLLLTSGRAALAPAECTSWLAVKNATADGRTILSKNRDKQPQHQVVILRDKPDENTYLAVSKDINRDDVGQGINVHALAVTSNVIGGVNLGAIGGIAPVGMNRKILQNCDSVESAYNLINKMKNLLFNEAVFLLADRRQAAIVEVKSRGVTMEIKPLQDCLIDGQNGRPVFGGRSNRFEDFPNLTASLNDHNKRRYERVMDVIQSAKGSFSSQDSFRLSRDHYYTCPQDPQKRAEKKLCYARHTGAVCTQPLKNGRGVVTISGTTFVIDPQYTELSVMWVTLGSPDSTLYIPIHLSVFKTGKKGTAIHPNWTSYTAYEKAQTIQRKNWWLEPSLDAFQETAFNIETSLIKAEKKVRENARAQLKAGNPLAAYKLLSDFDRQAAMYVNNTLNLMAHKKTPPPWKDIPLFKE